MNIQNQAAIAHIQRLTQEINTTYQTMCDERHRLAQWEETQEFSILGEIELLTSHLQGYAGQLLAEQPNQPAKILTHLHASKPFEMIQISDWYLSDGEQYPQICRYIELLDYLRLLLVEQLEQLSSQVAA